MAMYGGGLLDPYAGLYAGGMGPGGGIEQFLSPFWAPGASTAQRRRLEGPTARVEGGESGGGGAPAGTAVGVGGHRTREPHVVGSAGWTRSVPCDFIERPTEYIVRADIPGVKKSEIHVEVHDGNVLRFGHVPNAEREREDLEEPGTFHRNERVTTFRNRNLRMPDDADMSGELRARYEDGVLSVFIPKKGGAGRPEGRTIEVA